MTEQASGNEDDATWESKLYELNQEWETMNQIPIKFDQAFADSIIIKELGPGCRGARWFSVEWTKTCDGSKEFCQVIRSEPRHLTDDNEVKSLSITFRFVPFTWSLTEGGEEHHTVRCLSTFSGMRYSRRYRQLFDTLGWKSQFLPEETFERRKILAHALVILLFP